MPCHTAGRAFFGEKTSTRFDRRWVSVCWQIGAVLWEMARKIRNFAVGYAEGQYVWLPPFMPSHAAGKAYSSAVRDLGRRVRDSSWRGTARAL